MSAEDLGKSIGKKAKRGVAWSLLREGVTEAIVFPFSMLLARMLSPVEFGIAAAAGFFALLATRLSELGFNASLVRAKEVTEEHLSSVFIVNLTVGALMFVALVIAAPFVGEFYKAPQTGEVLPIAALSFLIVPFGTVPAAMLTRAMRYRESAVIDWYYSITFAVSAIVFAYFGMSYMSLVWARVVANLVLTGGRLYYARWLPSLTWSKEALKEILSFGAGVHAKRLLDFSAQNVDNLVVGKVMGLEALGFYDRAFSTMNRFLVRFNTGGPGVAFRAFAVIQDEPERFRRAYQRVVMATALIAFPLFAGLAVAANPVIIVLFGPKWASAAEPFRILCFSACFRLLNTYASSASQAKGRVWSEVWRQVLYVSMIVGTLVLLRAYGPVGAATGVLLSTLVMCVLMHILLTKVTPIRWSDVGRAQVPALMCAAGVVATELAAGMLLDFVMTKPPSQWTLLLAQVVGAAVFYIPFVLFAPHQRLRKLVREVAEDLAPPFVKRHPLVQSYLGMSAPA